MAETAKRAKRKIKKVSKKAFEQILRDLGLFEKFLNIVRGKVDVKNRLMLLLNPDIPKTSTRLTASQVDFVSLSHFLAKEFPEFEPLKDYATEFALASISREGWGVESSIRLNAAIQESKLFKGLLTASTETKKAIKGKA